MASESSNANLTGLVDDFYFLALLHGGSDADADVAEDDELFSISDEMYATELQLQEVLMSSAIAAATARSSLPPCHSAAAVNNDATAATSAIVIGECSSASSSSSSRSSIAATLVFCKICMDAVPPSDAHRASRGCAHAFCAACLAGYIGAKIQDRIADVKCPEEGCVGVLDPALCQGMLPREVLERWGAVLCESMVLGAKRAYCPFQDCSSMMVVDDGGADVAEDVELSSISDEKYAAELQLQEVLMSSAIAAATARSSFPPRHSAAAVNNEATAATSAIVIGECSSASSSSSSRSSIAATLVFCKICMDAVPPSDAHRASRGCAHAFCAACLAGYIGAKIQDRIADVKCPEEGCVGVLDPALCQGILPRDVFERWGASLCESMVLGAKRAYCPFKDCLTMLVVDDGDAGDVAESECPSCRRLFCAQCGVPWHAGSDCAAYRKLGKGDKGKEDMMLLEMAKGKKWKRCPRCEFFVEKVDGCLHITCRCGFEFCYGCGMKWAVTHICS